ncbi:hypothetical protein TRVA0_006S02476 [Trichomonascus vanleenenianus]|uniref:putative glycosylphosphatidylinositol-alpha 1,2 mannosyltransferase n=1 Tax=Trichomonascus vanleenenianus TaxID=2268995 RepID=UPI003EC9D758
MLYAWVYRILSEELGIDVVVAPKIFQAVIAAIGDYYMYVFARRILGQPGAKYALLASLGSAFNWFCITRTFSNSLEMVLTTVALAYWPWHRMCYMNYTISLAVASISCIFRPTNAIIWAFLGIHLVYRTRSFFKVPVIAIIIAGVSLSLNYLLDQWYYGEQVFPLLNFLEFNIVKNLAGFYGVSPWHYYLSQGIPILLIGYLPLTLKEMWSSRRSIIVWLIAFVVGAYSTLAHKEVRFIYPLLPLLHLLFTKSLFSFRPKSRKFVLLLTLLINAPVAYYFSTYHQRGVIDVVDFLRNGRSVTSVGFLMPCHSTPWQAHLHKDIPSWFLTCEPPIHVADRESYLDEADLFYEDPIAFLDTHIKTWPSHLVFFEALEPTVRTYLATRSSYIPHRRFFNSHFHDDWRRRGDVVVYKLL